MHQDQITHASTLRRRSMLAWMAACGLSMQAYAQAAPWPTRPIKFVLGYSPGGTGDAIARPLAEGLERILGQPVVMDYRPGASGLLAAEYVAKAAPDGYTLHVADNGALSVGPATRKVAYDPAALTHLGSPGGVPLVLIASPKLPVATLRELVEYAGANPGKLNYATGGIGGLPHLMGEQFKSLTRTDITHVPYKGLGGLLPDLISGRVAFGFFGSSGTITHIKAGTVRGLAVTSSRRIAQLADVPTAAEQGYPALDSTYQAALVAPGGLPPAVEAKLTAAAQRVFQDPAVVAALEGGGFSVAPLSPAATKRHFQQELDKWKRLVATSKINLTE